MKRSSSLIATVLTSVLLIGASGCGGFWDYRAIIRGRVRPIPSRPWISAPPVAQNTEGGAGSRQFKDSGISHIKI